jgi:hypothetical protein
MKRHRETGTGSGMTLKAELRLLRFQGVLPAVLTVNCMAIDATEVCRAVDGRREIGKLAGVAVKTTPIDFSHAGGCRVEDLCGIAFAVDVRLARSMARSADVLVLPRLLLGCTVGVRCKGQHNFLMTSGAGSAARGL